MKKNLVPIGAFVGALALTGWTCPLFAQETAAQVKSLKEQNSRLAAEEAKLLRELVGTNITQASDVAPAKRSAPVTMSEPAAADSTSADQVEISGGPPPLREIPEENVARKAPPVARAAARTKSSAVSSGAKSASEAALISNIQRTSMELVEKLREREQRIAALQAELDETRSRLIIAETEVERLSKHLDSRNLNTIGAYDSGKMFNQRASLRPADSSAKKSVGTNLTAPSQPAPESDMPVVTVTADKAALRTGPGPDNSPLMEVSRGTVLTVETRSGNWYRVNTPTGTRAWISGEVVRFGNGDPRPSTNLRMRGVDDNAEEKDAIDLIRQRRK